MESRAKILGHPIHQILVPLPLGVLTMSVVFDVIALSLSRHAALFTAAHYMLAAGVISALLAALFGLVDFLAIPAGTRAKRVAAMHGIGNVIVVLLFAASWFLRRGHPADPDTIAIALSLVAAAISGVTGWLGGELVDRLGVGVDDGAHLNAPSSLSGRIAR